jgi:hypothetical protein
MPSLFHARVLRAAPVLLLPMLAACNVTYAILDRVTGNAPAKFALFGRDDFRAGVRFAMLEHSATFESRVPFHCVELWPGARQCSLPIHPGKLIAVVDDRGRVARLTVVTAEPILYGLATQESGEFENAIKDTRDKWNAIRPAASLAAGRRQVEFRWRDASGRSGAALWYSPAGTYGLPRRSNDSLMALPDSLSVTDVPAYNELLVNSPFKNKRPSSVEVASAPEGPAGSPGATAAEAPAAPSAPPSVSPQESISAMHSDLRALSIAQETYLREQGDYARKLSALHLVLSEGVSLELASADGAGWSAVATHRALPGLSCVVYSGAVSSAPRTRRTGARAPSAGTIACDPT